MCKIVRFLRDNLVKFAVCVSASAGLVFSGCSFSAYAAPAVVPVAGEALYALLVALGLVVGNETGEYIWKGNGNPYVDSIFEEQVAGITSGIPISNEMLGELENTVIPENVYTTDGTDFYVSGNKITTSDLYITAKSLAGISYSMPVNVSGAQQTLGFGINQNNRCYAYCEVPYSDFGNTYYFFPYYITDTGSFIQNYACQFITSEKPITTMGYDFSKGVYYPFTAEINKYEKYLYFPADGFASIYSTSSADNFGVAYPVNIPLVGSTQTGVTFSLVSGSVSGLEDWVGFFPSITSCGLLRTTGLPVLALQGEKPKLENAIVKVDPPEDDDNDNKTPPMPQSPNNWELWKSFEDLIRFIDTGEDTNGNTDYGQYVNNNYNYVQVDINVPDEVNTNVNIGGNIGIDGTGDINITVHEDISLPSGGDGSGFYNPDAVDVIGALGKNNPVISVIDGLFSVLDPALVGVFSVSVSLLFVLGLWKLIRG